MQATARLVTHKAWFLLLNTLVLVQIVNFKSSREHGLLARESKPLLMLDGGDEEEEEKEQEQIFVPLDLARQRIKALSTEMVRAMHR